MVIENRFGVLLAEKGRREHRNISLREVSRETGCSLYTLSQIANDTIRELPMEVLSALCKYLEVTPGDLLIYRPDPTTEARDAV